MKVNFISLHSLQWLVCVCFWSRNGQSSVVYKNYLPIKGTDGIKVQSVLLQRDDWLHVRSRVIENHVMKMWSDKKNFVPSSNLVSSHRSLKTRNSQHACAKFRVIQSALTYSSIAL